MLLHICFCVSLFFLNDTPTPEIYPLPLHDALPISSAVPASVPASSGAAGPAAFSGSTASGGGGGCECVHAIATIKPVQRMWTPLLLLLLLVEIGRAHV